MNRRGMWQLILMAQEGDRQAIDELFFSSFRSAYLILYTLIGDKKRALEILSDSYVYIFRDLSTADTSVDFEEVLTSYSLKLATQEMQQPRTFRFVPQSPASADAFDPESRRIHDFNTLPQYDLSSIADEVLSVFIGLSGEEQLCAYLYYYTDMAPSQIAHVLGAEEKAVCGIIFELRQKALPAISQILQKSPAFKCVDAESSVLWALRNTKRYSLSEENLMAYHHAVTARLVDSNVLDTTMTDDDVQPISDDELQNFKPLPQKNPVLSSIFSLRTLIIVLSILVVAGSVFGVMQLREFNRRRMERDALTSRTILQMSTTVFRAEHYIFSTEYERTEPVATTEPETEPESTTLPEEATTVPEEIPVETTVSTTVNPYADFSYVENGTALTITGYTGTKNSIVIPSEIDGKPVTGIGENAFFNSSISGVKLPAGLRTIGKNAFHSCTSLQSISLPSGVTTIGTDAFRNCTSLSAIALSQNLQRIEAQAFYKCTALTTVALPTSLTYLGDWAFAYCSNLSSMAIPEKVTYLGKSLFYECKSLSKASIVTANRVTALGDSMFFGCTSLQSFTVPTSVRSIPANCFLGCRSLSGISMPSTITSIGTNAFSDCTSLASIKIPSATTRIEKGAFNNCTSLKEIVIPSKVTAIGESAFSGCSNLRTATIPASVKTIGTKAFFGCDDLVITCPEGSAAEKYAITNHIEIYGRTTEATYDSDNSML